MTETLQLAGLVEILRGRARLIATIVAGGTLGVCALAWNLPAWYQAKAQVVVEQARGLPINGKTVPRDGAADQTTILTELTVLGSHDLLANVRKQLIADQDFRAIRGVAAPPPSAWARVRALLSGGARTTPDPDASVPSIEVLQHNLKAFQEAGSHVIALTYTSSNAAEAAAIANKIAGYYVSEGDEQRRFALTQALSGLTGKLEELKTEMERLEGAAQSYQMARGLKDAAKTNVIDQRL